MYTLKGVFPDARKEDKKNFIKENMKQIKYVQGKTSKEPILNSKNAQASRTPSAVAAGSSFNPGKSGSVGQVKPPSKSGKLMQNINRTTTITSRKKLSDVAIKKGDMAEFLKRKETRQMQVQENNKNENVDTDVASTESSGRLRDIGCQTIESNLGDKRAQVLYSKTDSLNMNSKMKASGDTDHNCNPKTVQQELHNVDVTDHIESPQARSRLNAILEKKDNKDPYLPSGYQKGVVPKYLYKHKEQAAKVKDEAVVHETDPNCPPGHVTLPDTERKETLRMLRTSFAELVSELNKMPVKTDTLRMRNKKMELEKQLAKLEEGIKVFSRPKVFVKIE